MGPLHQITLGWLEVDDVPAGAVDYRAALRPVSSPEGRALRIPLTDDGQEYWLVEYRTRAGFDAALPGEGVLVWHVDPSTGPRVVPEGLPLASPYHLIEADGDDALRKLESEGGNRGVAGDVFARDGRVDSLTDRTTPGTRDHLGRPTGVAIRDLRVEDGVARLRVSTRDRFAVVGRATGALIATLPHASAITTAGGALPLTVTPRPDLPLPPGLSVSVAGGVIHVAGTPTRAGLQLAALDVRDAAGRTLTEWLSLAVLDVSYTADTLLGALLQSVGGPLGEAARAYLDGSGNANGTLDLGDVRAYLKRTGRL